MPLDSDAPRTPTIAPPRPGAGSGLLRRLFGAGAIALALLATAGCRKHETPEQVAYQFRDIFPYPVISGGGDDTTRLQPLQPGYFVYIKGDDFNAAAAEFERVARANPDLTEARLLQGISLVLADRPKDAIPVLESVIAEAPGHAPANWFLGQAYFSAGRGDDALRSMRTVASLNSLYAAEARKVLAAAD